MNLKSFADNLVAQGRELGFILGLKRANDILREHGVDVCHPSQDSDLRRHACRKAPSVRLPAPPATPTKPPPPPTGRRIAFRGMT